MGHRTNVYGRSPIVILGVLCHIGAYFLVFLALPPDSPIQHTAEMAYITPT